MRGASSHDRQIQVFAENASAVGANVRPAGLNLSVGAAGGWYCINLGDS